MEISNTDLQRKIDALKHSFVESLGTRLAEMEEALTRLDRAAPLGGQGDVVRVILEHAHKIAGSAGTFGYGEMSVTASAIERLCERILKGTHGADDAACRDLSDKMVDLRAEATR